VTSSHFVYVTAIFFWPSALISDLLNATDVHVLIFWEVIQAWLFENANFLC